MNKLYTILILILLLPNSGFAQQSDAAEQQKEKAASRSYTSVKAGINFTSFRGEAEGTSMQVGAHAGFYALYMESRYFGIQPEIQYSLQGARIGEDHLLMHYVVVPIMFKLFPGPAVSIQAGPYAGFLLSSKVETDSSPAQYIGKGQDFGFAYGLTFGNEGKLTVSARHHVGLSSLASSRGNVKNQVFQVSLGVCVSKK